MPVFPVTKIWPTGTFSRTRFWRLVDVGAKCSAAMRVMTSRLSSSGNGERLLGVRNPASTCITGMRMWNADSAAAIAELVSPCTRTAAGKRPAMMSLPVGVTSGSTPKRSVQKSSKRSITDATRALRLAWRAPDHRVTSGLMPTRSKM